jgi:isopenicillin-N epimerase
MDVSRRTALGAGLLGGLAMQGCMTTADAFAPEAIAAPAGASPQALARDERHWAKIAKLYDVTQEVVQLENANWGMMAKPVFADYQRQLAMVNRENSYYQRREYAADMKPIAERTAAMLGVSPDEIVFTRGATEALQGLIGGYNKLKPGDAVLYADLDYDSMITAMKWLKTRRGVDVIRMDMPEPATRQNVIDAYAAALEANPRIRLVLMTHVSHRTGLAPPVAEVADMARARGADVIVDAAHSFAQLDFKLPDLKADFVGVNLHKWVGAPIGVGVMYVRKDRIQDIDPFMGEPGQGISARVHSGTVNFAAFLTVPATLDVHDAIGIANKEARVRYLRDLWAEPLREHPRIQIMTPADPALRAGITSFRIRGQTSDAENIALAKRLLDEFNIFTVHRISLASGACIRVAPYFFNSDEDVLKLKAALETIAA